MKCSHGKERTRCRDCGGGSICPHQIVRSTCSICDSTSVYKMYRSKAAERQIPFLLTEQQFTEIVIKPCLYCGEYGSPRRIDRVENSRSYLLGNCVSSCGICNVMKRAYSREFFLDHIRKIMNHQEKLKQKAA